MLDGIKITIEGPDGKAKPAEKPLFTRVYRIVGPWRYITKEIPTPGVRPTISYKYLKDFGEGWILEGMFRKIENWMGKFYPADTPDDGDQKTIAKEFVELQAEKTGLLKTMEAMQTELDELKSVMRGKTFSADAPPQTQTTTGPMDPPLIPLGGAAPKETQLRQQLSAENRGEDVGIMDAPAPARPRGRPKGSKNKPGAKKPGPKSKKARAEK